MPVVRGSRVPVENDEFGRWVVIGATETRRVKGKAKRYTSCRCKCGVKRDVLTDNLLNGGSVSCGCLARELSSKRLTKHGFCRGESRKTGVYVNWANMKSRCTNPNDRHYHRYGGRGITICAEWLADFAAFRAWAMANGYTEGLTIERKDNDGNYCPENCTWITREEQSKNRSTTVWVDAFGERKCVSDWARDERCVVTRDHLAQRIFRGWNPEDAILTPYKGWGV